MRPDWVVVPAAPTLRKYGLDELRWEAIGERQGWLCPCGRKPGTGKFNIDHQHVRGWKTMSPVDRRQYVRGLVCWTCNFFQLAKGATPERLRALAIYLENYEYERRKDQT
jgi:hypothetical protein